MQKYKIKNVVYIFTVEKTDRKFKFCEFLHKMVIFKGVIYRVFYSKNMVKLPATFTAQIFTFFTAKHKKIVLSTGIGSTLYHVPYL